MWKFELKTADREGLLSSKSSIVVDFKWASQFNSIPPAVNINKTVLF